MSTDTGIKRKLCRELPREKGESFEVWHKELLDAAHGEGDEDASWAETYLGQDPRAGLTPAQTRRRAQRNRQAVSALLAVIPDTDLKAVIRAAAVNRPAGAPGLRTDATIAYIATLEHGAPRLLAIRNGSRRRNAMSAWANMFGMCAW